MRFTSGPRGLSYDPAMSLRVPRSSRPRLGLAAATLLIAAGAVGCGGDDDEGTTSTTASTPTAASTSAGPATTTTAGGTGGAGKTGEAPGQDEAAIRAAIRRAPAAVSAAKTARIEIELQNAGIASSGSGTVELTTERYAMTQKVGGDAGGVEIDNYGEKGRVYIRTAGQGWKVTANPVEGGDPLAQVRQLEKAKILKVRETAEFDGATCRWFDAEVELTDVLGNVKDPAAKALIEGAPKDAAIPVSSCVDDSGLTYAVDQEFEPGKVFGGAAASVPGKSVTKVRLSDYGTADAPKRPAGIDDAQPLGTGGLDTPSAG